MTEQENKIDEIPFDAVYDPIIPSFEDISNAIKERAKINALWTVKMEHEYNLRTLIKCSYRDGNDSLAKFIVSLSIVEWSNSFPVMKEPK